MTPSTAILDAIVDLIAADTATLAPAADANQVHLAKAPFTPAAGLDPATLTEADFTGATAKAVGLNAQQVFTDPVTGMRTVQLLEPAGGWHWVSTNTANLPQTIYGFWVTDLAGTALIGAAVFATPVQITGSGQGVDIPYIRFSFLNTSPI